MLVVITYDLNQGWNEVREAAFAGPFFNVIETTMGPRQAPNTTLFVQNMTSANVLLAFDAAVVAASRKLGRPITVEKVFVAGAQDWLMRSDAPKNAVRHNALPARV